MISILDKISIDFSIKPISYEKLNSQLTRCRCYVLAIGPNLNNTNFTLSSVEAAIPSLYNIPIVAHLMKKEDGVGWYVGGHDSKLTITDNEIYLEDQTVPFGCVPESCNPELVTALEPDGITQNTYLVADLILWTGRYNVMDAKYSDDIYFNQSCEVEIEQGEYENDYFRIDTFKFSALCLLGKSDEAKYNTRPCFPSSRVERKTSYSLDDTNFKNEYELLKEEIAKYDLAKIDNEEDANKMIEKLISKLAQYKYKNQYGQDVYKYAYIDHNKETVSVLDRENDNTVCAFKYSVADSAIDIDFDSRMDRSLTTRDKVDVEGMFSLNAEVQSAVSSALNYAESTAVNNISQQLNDVMHKFEASQEEIKSLKSKLDVYEKEKYEAQERALRIEREKIFEKYNQTLANNPEYLILKSMADKHSPEDIEKECLLIAGKQYTSNTCKYSLNANGYTPVVTSVAIDKSESASGTSRYGDLLDKVQ